MAACLLVRVGHTTRISKSLTGRAATVTLRLSLPLSQCRRPGSEATLSDTGTDTIVPALIMSTFL